MSRRLLLAGGTGSGSLTPPDPLPTVITPIPDDPIPYTLATSAPYNPPVACQIDTYDGSGLTLHPTVHDFGPGQTWNGYRYWMCHTPYPFDNSDYENPSIEASNNGWDWHTPAGLTNPIFPKPVGGYNSDPDFAWNPVLNRMELIWRPMDGERVVHSYSTNGINWSPFTTIVTQASQESGAGGCVSPSIVRVSATSWRIYARRGDYGLAYWSASAPTGPWTGPTTCGISPGGIAQTESENIWHLDAVAPSAQTGGRYLFLITSYPSTKVFTARSSDGVNIEVAPEPIITHRPFMWDAGWIYRASMTLHEDGTHARMWYSGKTQSNETRTGLTQIPLTEWDF